MHRKALCVLFLSLIALFSCRNHDADRSGDRTVFRYNESKGISSLDPAFARNQTIIWPVSQLFNGLVQLDNDLHVIPCIAHSWSVSDDGLVYTFRLRNDVQFHSSPFMDQRTVVASDVVYSFNRIRDPSLASPGQWIFDQVEPGSGFQALNDSVLRIKLKNPFPPFLSILAMPYCSVVPREVVEHPEADFARYPVGTGPFRFRLWSPDEKLVMLKNPDYFETDSIGQRLPYLDAVSITFVKDKQSEFLEFLKGNLDFLSGIHPSYKDELLTRSGSLNPAYRDRIRLITRPYLNTEYLGILMEPAKGAEEPLKERSIRKAINYGFDREKMMKYLRNNLGYPATGGMIPPGLAGHFPGGSGYTYQPDKAKKLLESAGYPGGEGLEPIRLTTTSDYLDLCEYIQFELSRIGIPMAIEVSTGASFRNMVANSNLGFFRGSWIADYADAENYMALFYSGNHSPEGPNYTHFSSSLFDSLYDASIHTPSAEVRAALYRKMDSIVIAEAPVVPLYYDMVIRFVAADIEGFTPDPMNNMILKQTRRTGHSASSSF
jgi:peptide/nickel transport system substrate-binding protein